MKVIMRCIFCLKNFDLRTMSEEHVFPDAIGGTYIIRTVCASCNSLLGSDVDNHLTNHKLVAFRRMQYRLGGRSGKIPVPFGPGHLADNPDHKFQTRVDPKTGILDPRTVRKVTKTPGETGINYSILLDSRDEHEVPNIIRKILTRNNITGISVEDVLKTATYQRHEAPTVTYGIPIDIIQYHRPLWKIAYEMAYSWLGDAWCDDDMALFLRNAIFDTQISVDSLSSYGIRGITGIFGTTPLSQTFSLPDSSLLCLMLSVEGHLAMYIRVFNIFEAITVVSSTPERYSWQKAALFMDVATGEKTETPLYEWMGMQAQKLFSNLAAC